MATTGVAVKGGKLLTRDGKVNITAASDCDNCCCLECVNCVGCSGAEEPNCANCGAPAGCCTPCEVEVVISGVDAGRCVNCRIDGPQPFAVNSLSVDGTHCVQQVSSCRWATRIVDAANISGRAEFNFGSSPCSGATCETRNVDAVLFVDLFPNDWSVKIVIANLGEIIVVETLCGTTISGHDIFDGFLGGRVDCKSSHGPISNALICTNINSWSDAGTATITPCCP